MTDANDLPRVGLRLHLLPAGGGLRRLSVAAFGRIFGKRRPARLPEHAGERVRCALTYVELEGRRPSSILRTDCLLLPLGPDGRLDRAEYERGAGLLRQVLSAMFRAPPAPRAGEKLVDARARLAEERYRRDFSWEPSGAELAAIAEDLLRPAARRPSAPARRASVEPTPARVSARRRGRGGGGPS